MMAKARLQRLLIVWMAVTGLILSTACTRGGGGDSAPIQQPTSTSPTPAPAPAETSTTTTSENTELAGGDEGPEPLDGDSSRSSIDNKPPNGSNNRTNVKSKKRSNSQTGSDITITDVDTNTSKNTTNTSAPADDSSTAAPGEAQIITLDPTGLLPSEIFGELSSNTNGQELRFSGAGQDTLRHDIQSFVDANTRGDRVKRDQDFAKSIKGASFRVNWSTRSAAIDVTLGLKRTLRSIRFRGDLNNKLLLRSGDLRHGQQLAIEAACMDLNGGCQTVYVKIQDGSGGVVKTAHMLIRKTSATLFTKSGGEHIAKNPEFDAFLEILASTVKHSGQVGTVNELTLRTLEVINGRSTYNVSMGIRSSLRTEEHLNLGGELLKGKGTTSLNAPAEVMSSSSPIAQTIRNVSLIQNDGHGDFTLAVMIRKGSIEASEDSMNITIARIHKPSRRLILK